DHSLEGIAGLLGGRQFVLMHEVTIDASAFLDRYVAAWNDADPERRRAALDRLYSDHGCIVTPLTEVKGAEAIVEDVGEVFSEFVATSGLRFRCAASTAHDRSLLMRWELTAEGRAPAGSGLNVLLLGSDGRIEADHQFSELQPSPETGAAAS